MLKRYPSPSVFVFLYFVLVLSDLEVCVKGQVVGCSILNRAYVEDLNGGRNEDIVYLAIGAVDLLR